MQIITHLIFFFFNFVIQIYTFNAAIEASNVVVVVNKKMVLVEMRLLRWMYKVTRGDKIINEYIRGSVCYSINCGENKREKVKIIMRTCHEERWFRFSESCYGYEFKCLKGRRKKMDW